MIRTIAVVALTSTLMGCAGGASAPQGNWTSKAALPQNVGEVGVAALDGNIYVVGGTEEQGEAQPIYNSTQNLRYDPAQDVWEKRAPLPQGLTHVGVAALDGKLYAIGGFANVVHLDPQPVAFVYDPETDTWSKLADISSMRGSVAAAAVDGKLHIFGGRISDEVVKIPLPPGSPEFYEGYGTVTTHQIYDPATGTWSQGAPMPDPGRDHLGIAVLGGKVNLFGGRTRDAVDNLARHDVYDPATDTWSSAAPLPVPRSAGAATVLNGQILYAGGECKRDEAADTEGTFADVTAYNPETDSWSTLTPLPQGRHAFGAATVNGVAYFPGGALFCGGGGGELTDMLALTLE